MQTKLGKLFRKWPERWKEGKSFRSRTQCWKMRLLSLSESIEPRKSLLSTVPMNLRPQSRSCTRHPSSAARNTSLRGSFIPRRAPNECLLLLSPEGSRCSRFRAFSLPLHTFRCARVVAKNPSSSWRSLFDPDTVREYMRSMRREIVSSTNSSYVPNGSISVLNRCIHCCSVFSESLFVTFATYWRATSISSSKFEVKVDIYGLSCKFAKRYPECVTILLYLNLFQCLPGKLHCSARDLDMWRARQDLLMCKLNAHEIPLQFPNDPRFPRSFGLFGGWIDADFFSNWAKKYLKYLHVFTHSAISHIWPFFEIYNTYKLMYLWFPPNFALVTLPSVG